MSPSPTPYNRAMPKVIDYGARFAQLQQAVFALVLAEGVHAPSRRSVAKVLGLSGSTVHRLIAREADLVSMAADEVVMQRRIALSRPPRDEATRDRAVRMLLDLVPLSRQRAEQELVWFRLTLATGQSEELSRLIKEHQQGRATLLERLAVLLGVPEAERSAAAQDLHLLVDGLTWAVCLGRLHPDDVVPIVEATVDRLAALSRSEAA
jgi:hypothetical protein